MSDNNVMVERADFRRASQFVDHAGDAEQLGIDGDGLATFVAENRTNLEGVGAKLAQAATWGIAIGVQAERNRVRRKAEADGDPLQFSEDDRAAALVVLSKISEDEKVSLGVALALAADLLHIAGGDGNGVFTIKHHVEADRIG
jgi:hypothetical protein